MSQPPHTYMDGHKLPLTDREIANAWERLGHAHNNGDETVTLTLREAARLLLSHDVLRESADRRTRLAAAQAAHRAERWARYEAARLTESP